MLCCAVRHLDPHCEHGRGLGAVCGVGGLQSHISARNEMGQSRGLVDVSIKGAVDRDGHYSIRANTLSYSPSQTSHGMAWHGISESADSQLVSK